jgi:Cu/Ag efflux pump CusA
VASATVDAPSDEPTLEVEVDLAAAQAHGIKAGDVRRAAATLLSGLIVGSLFEDQKVFDVVVWGTPQIRHSISSVQDLLIDTPTGGHVRLGDVATVRVASAPNVIKREGVARRIDVGISVRGRDLTAVAGDVQAAIAAVPFPLEHHAELLGGYIDRGAERERLIAFAVAAAVVIFLLLQAAFASWRLALVVFVGLPLALSGGVIGLILSGGVASLGSLAGFVAVFGLTARNGVGSVERFRRLRREDHDASRLELVLRAADEGLMPTLTTALATGLVFLPFVLLGEQAGFEIVRPMAFVLIGGLLSSTLLSLFVLPTAVLRPELDPGSDPSTARLFEQPGLSPA